MAQNIRQPNVAPVSLPASGDLSTKRGYLVATNSSGQVAVASAAGQPVDGVLANAPAAAGREAAVAASGTVGAIAGTGGVTMGDLIASASDGRCVPATKAYTNTNDAGSTTDPLIGSYIIGRALTSAAAGEYFDLQITHAGAVPTTAI